ncbi:MAG TPA: adenylate/guanylate cyclase domain-containing protein [Stellaceae bacterium]|jgi:adenylate cyclase|nr:adenylate/guanylate cyclase domain-containing protein [Stellaceae bacterium]
MGSNLSAIPELASPPEPATRTSGEEFFRIEGVYTGLGAPILGGEVGRWLLVDGPHIDSEIELFDELCWRLVGDGVPLWRASFYGGTLHPQIRGVGARWWGDRKVIEDYRVLHGSDETDEYKLSPIRLTVERGTPMRRRLDRPAPEYPLLEKIRKAGGTDYFALALNRTFRRFPAVAWATDRPGGFSDADIAKLEEINPALAAIAETRAVRRISANLLDTYLGPQAGRRILAGQIFRAQGERMRAVIMMTDMRNFTGLSDRLPGDSVIELLDDYFDAVVSPIEDKKGEVLKFIGDGVLAIFPAEDDEDFAPSSLRALEAATEGLERLAAINLSRRERQEPEFRIGIGLHLGEVIYGNVGAADRLDFTVIGPAVNLASRIEGLTKRLLRPLLTSSAFAEICPRPLVSLGFHPVRGLHQPEEVFGLPER